MRKVLAVSILISLCVTAMLLVGHANAQEPLRINVTVREFAIDVSVHAIPTHTPFQFVVTNQGQLSHELVLEKAGDDDKAVELDGDEAEVENIAPGATKESPVWTINDVGQYQIACHVQGHYEAGMVHSFTILAAGSPLPQPDTPQPAPAGNGFPIELVLGGAAAFVAGGVVGYRLKRLAASIVTRRSQNT